MHSCFRFLLHDWKSKNISVPPGHRVILSQFIEKIKQRIMLTSTNTCKSDAKKAEVRCKYSKRVKVEEREDDHGISYVSTNETHPPHNLLEKSNKIRKQIVKWQNSQKETQLKQLKEHKDFEIKFSLLLGLIVL